MHVFQFLSDRYKCWLPAVAVTCCAWRRPLWSKGWRLCPLTIYPLYRALAYLRLLYDRINDNDNNNYYCYRFSDSARFRGVTYYCRCCWRRGRTAIRVQQQLPRIVRDDDNTCGATTATKPTLQREPIIVADSSGTTVVDYSRYGIGAYIVLCNNVSTRLFDEL